MIVPTDQYDALAAQYGAAANPMDFMADVTAAYLAMSYPGTFQMSAIHVIGERAFLYKMKTTDALGRQVTQPIYSATGMILQDVERQWFSESFGVS